MKKIVFALFLLFSFCNSYSQITYTPQTAAGYQFKYVKSDSGFALPFIDTSLRRGVNRIGAVVARPQDSLLYYWTGAKWSKINADVSGLISLINSKVDSVTVYGNDLKYWINGVAVQYSLNTYLGNLQTVTNNGNTTTNDIQVNRLQANAAITATQINASDYLFRTLTNNAFADSLRGYIKGDSLTHNNLNWYLPDTTGTFVLRINGVAPDKNGNVTGLFGGGSGSLDTTTIYNNLALKLNIADTADMLNDYVNQAGNGLQKLSNKVIGLGGTLNQHTTIDGDGGLRRFIINNPQYFRVNTTADGTFGVTGSGIDAKGATIKLTPTDSIMIIDLTTSTTTNNVMGLQPNGKLARINLGSGLALSGGVLYNSAPLGTDTSPNETKVCYVDSIYGNNSTARLGDKTKPFATIDRALDSLPASGGVIHIGIGTFASPSPSKIKNNVTFIGTQIPSYNWTVTQTANNYETATAPTRLVNGTILQGTFQVVDFKNIRISNLGVDCGSEYVSNGGIEGNCIAFGVTGSIPYAAMPHIEFTNIILLGKNASSLYHCLVVEGAYNVTIDNVTTCFSTHGIAVKSTGLVSINNTRSYSHTTDGIIIKGDTRAVGEVKLSNFLITSLDRVGFRDGGGLIIENSSTVVKNINISNGYIYGTSFGVLSTGNASLACNIYNVQCYGTSGVGFNIQTLYNSSINNCTALYNDGDGFYLRTDATFSNSLKLSNCKSLYNGGDGFDLSGTTYPVIFSELYANTNTGFGIRAGSNVYGALYENVSNTAGATTGTIIERVSIGVSDGDKGDVVISSTGAVYNVESVNGELNLKGITTPSQYTADQNDASFTGSTIVRVSTNSDARVLTSIAGGTDGRIIKLINVGSNDLILQSDDGATGTAANRFEFNGVDVVIEPKEVRLFVYDGTISRWVKIGYEYDLTNVRRQPIYNWDYIVAGVATANFPTTAISSGTATYINHEASHPGYITTTSSTTTNSGHHSYYLGLQTAFFFQGGETYEAIYQPKVASNTNTTTRFGFLDATTSADAVDGAYFEIPAGSFAVVGKTANNSTRTTSATIATIAVDEWYRFKVTVNRAASSVKFEIFDANGVLLGSQSNTANIPTTSARSFGAGYISTNVGTVATLLGWLDYQAVQLGAGKAINR